MNIVVAGPCGVGKSTVAKSLAEQVNATYLDLDEIRSTKKNSIPCMLNRLNIVECLSSELDKVSKGFILDIGGDTMFRLNVDNNDRLQQIHQLKTSYLARVVVLTVDRNTLFNRYMSSKPDVSSKHENFQHFENIWSNWETVEKPNWEKCADLTIDTKSLTTKDTVTIIKDWVHN